MYIRANPNPDNELVGDCVVRALSIALGREWQDVYIDLCLQGLVLSDMPSSNRVWKTYLQKNGFTPEIIPNSCPDCYTVRDFAQDHPTGTYIIGTGTHAIAAINGDYYDTWDSGNEIPLFYFYRE